MTKFKSCPSLFLVLPLIFTILVIHLNPPTDAQAKPLAGFTPTPVPPGGGGGGSNHDNSKNDDDRPTSDKPTDYILVQVDHCILQCSTASAYSDNQPDFQPLASTGVSDTNNSVFIPLAKPQDLPEILLPVQLVHDGSGFIVEGELSDMKPTRFAVPYPGHWQIWVMGNPRFMTAEAVDVTGSNLADLHSQLANGPISLGTVEADTLEPQLVKCPLACALEKPPTIEAPLNLPETGGQMETKMSFSTFLAIITFNISLVALTLWAVLRRSLKDPHC